MPLIIDGNNGITQGTLSIGDSSGISLGSVDISNDTGITVGTVNISEAGANKISPTSLPFLVGQVCFFARSTAPDGFLKCNGAAVSRTTYSALFFAIGTIYGAGDGSTTFNLPDLRGEFLRCLDDGRGIDSGRALGSFQDSTRVIGQIASSSIGYGGRFGSDNDPIDNGDIGSGNVNVSAWGDLSTAGAIGSPWYRYTAKIRPRNISQLACIKF